MFTQPETGARIRQLTSHPAIHHHPFFFIPAYDDKMRWVFFVSHRTGSPQIFACQRDSGELIQLTDRPDLNEWSVHPAFDGTAVYFTAGLSGWRLDLQSLREDLLAEFHGTAARDMGMVASGMGTTSLSRDGRWWAVSYKMESDSELMIIDTHLGTSEVILRRDSISHMQFCPDDSSLLFYAGPLTDRVWLVNRDGTHNRRLYRRNAATKEWVTHEIWLPGRRELAFVEWPNGMKAINIETGTVRRVTSFNAWHAAPNRHGDTMIADTNYPDRGLQVFSPLDSVGEPKRLCLSNASSQGKHWAGPFPYDNGPVEVYAPQHTHPHPVFSPDGQFVVFTSDQSGWPQLYEVRVQTPHQLPGHSHQNACEPAPT